MKNKNKSFSLVELLLVSALLPFAGLVIYGTFNSATKIYQRLNQNIFLEEINFFLDNFRKDLKDTLVFNGIAFKGESKRLEFASFVYEDFCQAQLPGKIIYQYDPYKKVLQCQRFSYTKVFGISGQPQVTELKGVVDLQFKYYYYKPETKEFVWEESALYDKLPLAVRVDFALEHDGKENPFVYTVSLPIAS